MKKQQQPSLEEIKPDLKHDTMEYAASTEGDDVLDSDNQNREEDEVSAEELEYLEDDSFDAQAEALNSVETDCQADDEVIFDEEDIDEASDTESVDQQEE